MLSFVICWYVLQSLHLLHVHYVCHRKESVPDKLTQRCHPHVLIIKQCNFRESLIYFDVENDTRKSIVHLKSYYVTIMLLTSEKLSKWRFALHSHRAIFMSTQIIILKVLMIMPLVEDTELSLGDDPYPSRAHSCNKVVC